MDIFSLLDEELSARSTWMPNVDSLEFVNDPVETGPYQNQDPKQIRRPNVGLYALTLAHRNQIYLEYEDRFCNILDMLEPMDATDRKESTEDRVLQELIRINQMKGLEWSGQRSKRGVRGAIVNTESYFVTRHPRNPTLHAIYVTVLVMYILYRLPRRGAAVLLAGMMSILKSQPSLRSLADEVPIDPRKLLLTYDLDPVTRSYVCCPSCYYLYEHSPARTRKRKALASSKEHCDNTKETNSKVPEDVQLVFSTPSHCTHRRVRAGPTCGEPLFDTVTINAKAYTIPQCKYEVQDLKQWIGRLLSRPRIEEHVFRAFRRPRKEYMEDVWDAGHLCKILLKKGERFLPGPANETRLVFSFSMDSFNPYHMKEAKQTVSSTAIWLILLNLPVHLRYRPENMFLAGIIPGPKKPSLSDINHSLKLLVDVLLEFFDPGVLYSRTARHELGCRVRAILVPVVSDMLAARQAGGFASPTATYFCTRCMLKVQDIENLDIHSWPQRDVVEHIKCAKQWHDAESLDDQNAIFRACGIRWSPLLHLPYWNPILFTAIEPMHVFDAGLFQSHCRQVWGIDTSNPGGDGTAPLTAKAIARPPDAELEKWYQIIRSTGDPERLGEQLNGKDCAHDTLWHICHDNNLRRAGNKLQLAMAIAEWRKETPPEVIKLPSAPPYDKGRHTVSTRFSAPETDVESRSVREGSITTDDSVTPSRFLSPDRVPSECEQKAVDKCVQQLVDCAARNTVLRAKKIVLQFVCRDYCKLTLDKLNNLGNKEELYAAATAWVEANVPPEENPSKQTISSSNCAVLGKDVMEAVWADMALTELPSWVSKAPSNWGTTMRGKLSANNWKVICTVHLPITLIRLWGGDDLPDSRKAMLENFMDLVRAVQVANLRSISMKEIELYEYHIFRYVTSFKALYKLAKVKPIHHAALHYGDILRGFGPAHTHSAAFYERHIHSMQSKNHNMKLGELESTFMRSSAREANLIALLEDDSEARSRVGDLVETYRDILAEDVRGTRLAHMIDAVHLTQQAADIVYDRNSLRESSLPGAILAAFKQFLRCKHPGLRDEETTENSSDIMVSPKAKVLDKFSLCGVQYSTASRRTRDSHVFFRSAEPEMGKAPPSPQPGQITHIFIHPNVLHYPVSSSQHKRPSVYVCVQPYAPLQPSSGPKLRNIDQMYRRFGFAGGFLCRNEFASPIIIEPSSVISHVAVTPLKIGADNVFHVLPMDRLMQTMHMEDVEVDEYTT